MAGDYQFGPFRLDATKRRLWRGEELVPLTPKAFDTLLVLVSRAGKVVEKDEILKAVWPDTFVEEATLAQNISTLRKALGDTETPTYIATVPRRGYRFLETVTDGPNAADLNAAPDSDRTPAPPPMQPAAARKRVERIWIAISATLALGLVVVGIAAIRTTVRHAAPVMFTISPSDGTRFSPSGGFMTVSPDGRYVVFVASDSQGIDRLWLRSLDSVAEHMLPGTEGAFQPFWSPDSRFIAFFADDKLKKVGIAPGPVRTICNMPSGANPLAGTWNTHDDILFSAARQGITRVSASGGTVTSLVPLEPADDSVAWPQFLPDGRHFLYLLDSGRPDRTGIYVGALDSPERTRIAATRSYALYAPSGHLLFIKDGTLVAQPFNSGARELTGSPVPLAERVAYNASTARGVFALSQNGVLMYQTVGDTQLVWFDRAGKSLGPVGAPGGYLHFAISPDTAHVAAARLDPQTGTSHIWVLDAQGGEERRLTFDTSWETRPLWSRVGSRIAFNTNRRGRWEVYEKTPGGDGPGRLLLSSETSVLAEDWAPDDRLVFERSNQNTKDDFQWQAPGGDAKPASLPYLEADEDEARISPDGRWLAYRRYESGSFIYVRPVHSMDSRWQVSSLVSQWAEPRWRGDGRELFYLSPDLSVMAVDIQAGAAFRPGMARRLFQTRAVAPSGLAGQAYDVTSDGQRFLVKVPASFSPITVVVNWTSLLQDRR
jgi:DNA-binding winged helix-turn-helix (wHTH) protein